MGGNRGRHKVIRRIYAYILRHHPPHFRDRFESEMLATFDDVARRRNSVALLFDAVASLIRQWIFRSRYWRQEGVMALSDLRRHSDEKHRRVWRINFFFLLVCLLVIFNLPRLRDGGSAVMNAIMLSVFAAVAYRRHKQGIASVMQMHQAVSITSDVRRMELVRKRESLRLWSGGGSLSWPWEGPMTVLFFILVASDIAIILRIDGAGPWTTNPLRFWLMIVGTAGVLVLWHFVREENFKASETLQREIDAIDHGAS
jgi:hypothetical protein